MSFYFTSSSPGLRVQREREQLSCPLEYHPLLCCPPWLSALSLRRLLHLELPPYTRAE
jgi:hypothetical protein